jgi:hypothetical protein
LRGKTLQVIVKLANIELTPENPNYPGGSWHVEGMKNESIVASGIYYYASENISKSELRFRTPVTQPLEQENQREQGEGQTECSVIFGMDNGTKLNQPLGSVITQENRCIAFPNIFQHQVAPFTLEDKTKPGKRKILVFFLVDPGRRVLSTATVPPQQAGWLVDEVAKMSPFKDLPKEIMQHVGSFMRWPMTRAEAEIHREALMSERKYFIKNSNEKLFERQFSLCEH